MVVFFSIQKEEKPFDTSWTKTRGTKTNQTMTMVSPVRLSIVIDTKSMDTTCSGDLNGRGRMEAWASPRDIVLSE